MIGILLCGGRGRRMGAEKAGVSFGRATLLEHGVARLRSGCSRVILCARLAIDHAGVADRVVGDPEPDSGPLGGLLGALEACDGEPAFVVAVDQPWVSVAIAQEMERRRGGAPAICFRSEGVVEVFHAVYGPEVVGGLRERWRAGERSIRGALIPLGPRFLAPGDLEPETPRTAVERALLNLNRPEDLEAARRDLAALLH